MKLLRIIAGLLIVGGAVGLFVSSRSDHQAVDGVPSLGVFQDAPVVVVTLDTTRSDHFGCYGSRAGFTPVMDELASEGVLFEHAQAVAPVTLPSHTSMFTGLYQPVHGVRNNGIGSLDSRFETLAEVLSDRGYATGAFVSAEVLASRYGLDQGFEVYDDDLTLGNQLATGMVPSRRGDVTLAAALAWLDSVPAGEPFFLWYHVYDPHAPYLPPPEYRRQFPNDPYGAEIAFSDALVGQLVERLKARGVFDETVFTVIADHGESLGEHGERTHGILLHQATTHVPWILRTPDLARPVRVQEPISGVELAPVLASLVGVPAPNERLVSDRRLRMGRSESEPAAIYSETTLPFYQYRWKALRGLRHGDWQLVSGVRDELFNLRRDPRELIDLSGSEDLYLRDLQGALEAVVEHDDTLDEDAASELRPSEREALAALGYLTSTSGTRANPPDPRDVVEGHVNIEKSRDLIGAGRYEDALESIDGMLSEDPENLMALQLKAQTLLELNRLEYAKQVADAGLQIDSSNAMLLALLCRIESRQGHFDRALEIARVGKSSRGAYGMFHAIEARLLWATGAMAEGDRVVQEGLEMYPEDAELLVTLAQKQSRENRSDAAIESLRTAVASEPFHAKARKTLAQHLVAAGRAEEAALELEESLRFSPREVDSHLTLGRLYLAEDPTRSLPYLEEAARLAPGRADVLTTLGIAYLQAGRAAEGEATLRRATSLAPDDAGIRNNLGIALKIQGDVDGAIEVFEKLTEQNPRFAEGYNNLAVSLMEKGEYERAERSVQEALSLKADYLDARLTYAEILRRTGRIRAEAAELERVWTSLKSAQNSTPRGDEVEVRYGIALSKTNRCGDAVSVLQSSQARHNGLPLAGQLALAACLEQDGRYSEALQYYEAVARKSAPGDDRQLAEEGVRRVSMFLE